MNELDLARAIRDGTESSPSQCGNSALHDVRISGTGWAERKGESVFRDRETWCYDDMVQRAAGLPVVFGHPEQKILDGPEFIARIIGAVVLPYARDGEFRGIARIFDAAASEAMASGELSTSPGVLVGGAYAPIKDGLLLIENDPSLLDHIAIVPRGVWDKGKPPSGIRNDSTTTQENKVPEEINEKPQDNKPDRDDKLLATMTAIGDMCGGIAKRMDALEAENKARADADIEKRQLELKQSGGGSARDFEKERADSAEKAECQARADAVFMTHGKQAPPSMAGETTHDYRIRLMRHLQLHSKEFGKADLNAIADSTAFDFIEQRIYADALAEASCPSYVPPGRLQAVTTRSPAGHTINTYHGRWEDCFGRFMQTPRLVSKIVTQFNQAA